MYSNKLVLSFLLALLFIPAIVFGQSGWFPLSSGTSVTLSSVCFPASGGGNLGFVSGYSGKILVTTNAGVNWSSQNSTTTNDLLSVFFINNTTGWAAGGQGTILYTTNGGTNWTQQTTPSTQLCYSIYFINEFTGWSCGSLGLIFYTTNSGANWISEMSTTSEYLRSVFFTSPTNGICTGRNGKIIKTTNAGANWYDVGPSITSTLYSVFFVNANTGWSVGFGTLITTNGGANWSMEPSSGIFFSVYFPNASTGWKVASDGGIYVTTNSGTSWSSQSVGGTNWLYSVYFTSVSTGYVAGDAGTILKTTDGGGLFVGVPQIGNNIPKEFKLYQNYPNPFNPTAIIKFDLPNDVKVLIRLYDILGREVKKLVDEFKKAGSYEINFDGTNLASGVYFYRIEAGDFVEAKKMVLVK